MSETNKSAELARQIELGQASIEEKGVALKALQASMAVSLYGGLNRALESTMKSTACLDELVNKFKDKLEYEIEGMSPKDILEMIDRVQSSQLRILDLQRKIVQGKELIPQPSLSEEESHVIKLMNSFTSVESKKKFLSVVKDFLDKEENNSFDE